VEAEHLIAALKALAEHGSIALLSGMIVIVLWRKLSALQKHYEGDPDDPTGTKIGVLAQMRIASQKREDALRKHYETLIEKEREENKQLWRETNEAFKGLIEGV